MKPAEFVPLSVYLKSVYEPDAEYVDGEIEERPSGEDDHSAWQAAISFWFRQHAKEWGVRVRPGLRIQDITHPVSGSRCDHPGSRTTH